jgi:hypothetical protein
MENNSLEGLYLNWDSASAGTNGKIPIEVELDSEDANYTFYILVLVVIISSMYMFYSMTRADGPE